MESRKTDHLCPRCALPLYAGKTEEIEVCGCGQCGGVWLDTSGAASVTQTFDRGALQLADLAARHAGRHIASAATVIPCPVCRAAMKRSAAVGGAVIIDTCRSHGTWYDKGELQAAAEAMRSPRRTATRMAAGAAALAAGAVAAPHVAAALQDPNTSPVLGQLGEGALDVVGDVALEIAGEAVAQGASNVIGAGADLAASAGASALELGASAAGAALEAGVGVIGSAASAALEAAPGLILDAVLGVIGGIFSP